MNFNLVCCFLSYLPQSDRFVYPNRLPHNSLSPDVAQAEPNRIECTDNGFTLTRFLQNDKCHRKSTKKHNANSQIDEFRTASWTIWIEKPCIWFRLPQSIKRVIRKINRAQMIVASCSTNTLCMGFVFNFDRQPADTFAGTRTPCSYILPVHIRLTVHCTCMCVVCVCAGEVDRMLFAIEGECESSRQIVWRRRAFSLGSTSAVSCWDS